MNQPDYSPSERSNPLAGVLIVIGGLAGIAAGLLPWGPGELVPGEDHIGIVGALRLYEISSDATESVTGELWRLPAFATTIIAASVLGLLLLIFGMRMFGRAAGHGRVAASCLVFSLLLAVTGVAFGIITRWQVVHGGVIPAWLLLLAGVPAVVGSLIGFTR